MKIQKLAIKSFGVILFVAISLFLFVRVASAHCDALDGPVVSSARRALKSNNASYALIWVKPEYDDEIRKALKKAKAKIGNAKSKDEKDKAEMEFFEVLVRLHRKGEGADYDGIKPAGSVDPEILLADKAVETGDLSEVMAHIHSDESKKTILHLFHELKEKSHYDVDGVAAGREFVEAYATFIHAAESAIKGQALHGHESHEH